MRMGDRTGHAPEQSQLFCQLVVYPPIVIMLMIVAPWRESPRSWIEAAFACLAGVMVWTLLEYVIHRIVLHEVQFFAEMHYMHHDQPTGFVGTPTWLSLGMICCGALLPLWWETVSVLRADLPRV